MTRPRAHINAIATAVPGHDIHAAYIGWARERLVDERERALFDRMVERAGITHRWSVLPEAPGGGSPVAPGGFYAAAAPGTAARMALYAQEAPKLAMQAIRGLGPDALTGITQLVVASCTGFVAPGIDQIIAAALGLGDVERTLIGFMGCYAAAAAMRGAHHIVRSEPGARVLVVTIELSSLHLQDADRIEPLLAELQFGDGAAAALVTADPQGLAIEAPFTATLPQSEELIRWTIGDTGFEMLLSGEVPGRIGAALQEPAVRDHLTGGRPVDLWAVHAGGRSILDAVERSLELPADALDASRGVLERYGNMSSSTLMFVLADLLASGRLGRGIAIAFGPGLAAEGFRFERTA